MSASYRHRPGGAGGLTAMSGLAEIILPPRFLAELLMVDQSGYAAH
jgi:hypothetical protein